MAISRSRKGFHYIDVQGRPLFDGLFFKYGPSQLMTPPGFLEYLSAVFTHGPNVLVNVLINALFNIPQGNTTSKRGPGGFQDGMGAYSTEDHGLIGFIDREGTMFKPRYTRMLSYFSEGLCAVELPSGKKAYINKQCEEVIDISNCTHAGEFINGLAAVWVGEKLGNINRLGEYVWEPRE